MTLGYRSPRKLVQLVMEVSGTSTVLHAHFLIHPYKGDSIRPPFQRGPRRLRKGMELGQVHTALRTQQDSGADQPALASASGPHCRAHSRPPRSAHVPQGSETQLPRTSGEPDDVINTVFPLAEGPSLSTDTFLYFDRSCSQRTAHFPAGLI